MPAHTNSMAHAHALLGIALIDERKMAPALVQFRAAVAADPNNKIMRFNLAEAYTRDSQYEQALKEAREAARLAPDDPLAHRALGSLLGHMHQPEASLQELQTAIRLEPQNAQNKVLLGLEYAGMYGHIDDAVSTLQEASVANPNSELARKSLERTQNLKANVDLEIARERELLRSHPDDADVHYRLAKAEARAGDLKGAIQDYQKSAELRPDNGTPYVDLAELYLVQGDPDTAWAEIRKARALGVEPPQALLVRMPQPK
jgi:tetratricopeptide (TPR) repeat protein